MKKFSKKNRVPTLFFVVAGIMVLGITGFMLSDAGKKFYEPGSKAETCPPADMDCITFPFSNYDYSCSTSGDPNHVDRFCCKGRVEYTAGVPHCADNTTPPVTTPPGSGGGGSDNCNTYTVFNLNSCSNTPCSTQSVERCEPKSLTGATEKKCVQRSSGVDEIVDCCPVGQVSNGSACVASGGGGGTIVPTTSTAGGGGGGGGGGGTSTIQCVVYGLNYPATMCTNQVCPVPTTLCQEKDFATATYTKCVAPSTTGKVRLYSCCAANQVLQNGKCITVATKPEVVTKSPATLVTRTSAKLAGQVTSDGGSAVKERGFVYSTNTAPRVEDATKKVVTGKVGQYSASVTGLSMSTKYYFRAYAENAKGISYGAVKSFTTLGEQNTAPVVETNDPSDIGVNSATVAGAIVSDGGTPVTERGFVYSSSVSTPDITNATVKTVSGTESEYSTTITELNAKSKYFYRAYAKNVLGVAYGETKEFTTKATDEDTPSITHKPGDTGFADEPLLYIGGILYVIGVVSFVAARYYGAARRKL